MIVASEKHLRLTASKSIVTGRAAADLCRGAEYMAAPAFRRSNKGSKAIAFSMVTATALNNGAAFALEVESTRTVYCDGSFTDVINDKSSLSTLATGSGALET